MRIYMIEKEYFKSSNRPCTFRQNRGWIENRALKARISWASNVRENSKARIRKK